MSVLSMLLAAGAVIQNFWHHPGPDNSMVQLRDCTGSSPAELPTRAAEEGSPPH